MSPSLLTPSIARSRQPPFHEMDWQEFQRLTTAVLGEEPDIATSNEYGMSGQSDRGADVLARVKSATIVEVASCKVRKTISPAELSNWSEDFLKHWDDHWKNQNVRRFILATTARKLTDCRIQDQISCEIRRFAELEIQYELWGPEDFVRKLRPHRALAARYIVDSWVEIICGPATDSSIRTQSAQAIVDSTTVAQIAELQGVFSGQAAKRVENALDDLRAGNRVAVVELANELREDSQWRNLTTDIQARIVRLEASVALREARFPEAQRLSDEADSIAPPEEPRLAAQIAAERDGIAKAIELLGTPKTAHGKQLLASLKLQEGELREATTLIDTLLSEEPSDPETLRLKALSQVMSGDRSEALIIINEAEKSASNWSAIMLAGAIVRYAQAFSPFVDAGLLLAPNPVDSTLVKSDPKSVASLEYALTLFERWDEAEEKTLDLLHWRLAVFCNLPNRQDDASRIAAEILESDAADVTAIAWTVTRHLDVDTEPSLAALRAKYLGGADHFQVRALALMIALDPSILDKASILKDGLDQQEDEARIEAEDWIARFEGNEEPRAPDCQSEDYIGEALRWIQHTDDWSELPALLQKALLDPSPSPGGLVVAQFAAENGKWDELADCVEPILVYATADAVRLAAFICSRLDQPARSLEIIRDNAEAFGETLPADILRLQADANVRLGKLAEALRDAERLVGETGLLGDRLTSAEIQARTGDLHGARPILRQALREQALQPIQALKWSQVLDRHDQRLARGLLRFATEAGVEDRYAPAAMYQALRLGLDDAANRLMPQVNSQAVADGEAIKLVALEEVIESVRQQRDQQQKDEYLYLRGAIPAHLLVHRNAARFENLYLGFDAPGDHRLFVRMTRHGGRPSVIEYNSSWHDWRLHLDISALFEAYSCGLLDELECHPHPIRISPRVPTLLIEMERDCIHNQPSRLATISQVLEVVDQGKIAVTYAQEPEGLWVVHCLFEDVLPTQRHFSALLNQLVENGLLDASQIKGFAGTGIEHPPISLSAGDPVCIDFGSLEQLAELGVLQHVTDQFSVSTVQEGVNDHRQELLTAQSGEEIARKISAIRDFVTRENVELLPLAPNKDFDDNSQLIGSMEDILMAPEIENGFAWIDDRFTNGHTRTNSLPIVSTVEVLAAMVGAGRLSEREFRERLNQLRGSGAAFVPYQSADILLLLSNASVISQRIAETDELVAIRRGFAANLRLACHLKIGDGDEALKGRPDEFEFAKTLLSLVSDCLEEIWRDESTSLAQCYAASDWIWTNLRMCHASHAQNADDPERAHDLVEVMQICHCLDKSNEIGGLLDERRDRREYFLNWLWQRVIAPRILVDSSFLERIGDYLEQFYSALLADYRGNTSGKERQIFEALLRRRIVRLPNPISDVVLRRDAFAYLGVVTEQVTVGRMSFDLVMFWKAARAALRYGRGRIRNSADKIVRIRCHGDGLLLGGRRGMFVADNLLLVLAARKPEFDDALDAFLDEIELDDELRLSFRERASKAHEPHRLVAVLNEANQASAKVRYQRLFKGLNDHSNISIEEFAPTLPSALEHYLGFSGGSLDLDAAYRSLSARRTPTVAIQRLRGIPITLPELPPSHREVVEELRVSSITPMGIIQLASLSRRMGIAADSAQDVRRLIDVIDQWGDLYVAILKWVWRCSFRDSMWRSHAKERRMALVWAHADHLLETFIKVNARADKAVQFFDEHGPELQFPDVFASSNQLPIELYHPFRVSPEAVLYHGLAEMFGRVSLDDELPPELIADILDLMVMKYGDDLEPKISLMARCGLQTTELLTGFLDKRPEGVFPEELEPGNKHAASTDGALNALEADLASGDAWLQLAVFSTAGLSDEQWARTSALLKKVDFWQLPNLSETDQYLIWRGVLTPAISRDADLVRQIMVGLARRCEQEFRDQISPNGSLVAKPAHSALGELVEICALIASHEEDEECSRKFSYGVQAIADNWPSAAESLRHIVENLLVSTNSSRSEDFWALSTYLRTFR